VVEDLLRANADAISKLETSSGLSMLEIL